MDERTSHAFAVAGCVLILFIGLCHEFVGAVVFPWGPAVLGGPLGWHALGLGGMALALLLLGAVLGRVPLPVAPMALAFVAIGVGLTAYTAASRGQFHFFAASLVVAALGVLAGHRRTG